MTFSSIDDIIDYYTKSPNLQTKEEADQADSSEHAGESKPEKDAPVVH